LPPRKTDKTKCGEKDRQYLFERSVHAFSQVPGLLDELKETLSNDRSGSTITIYTVKDWAVDVTITENMDAFAQCCRRHANLSNVRGKYGEKVYKDTSEGVNAYQCESCGWWRYGDLCGPE